MSTVAYRALIALFVIAAPAALAMAGDPAQSHPKGWSLNWTANPQLPPVFRQFVVSRSDGSSTVGFLSDFDDGLSRRKGLLVYLDGSGAQSLFSIRDGRTGMGMFGVLAQAAQAHYHVAAVEKRGVRFGEAGMPGSGERASAEYTAHACRAERIADVRLLLDALLRQSPVDAQRVVLVGHSEGADVAAGVAATDPRITHVAFLSGGGPSQMFDLLILTRKRMAREGKSPEQTENAVRQLEGQFQEILGDPLNTDKFFMGHAYRRWSGFLKNSPVEALLKSRAKLYLAHGTEDESVPIESFDLLVLELLRVGRDDAVVRRYPGRGHGLSASDRPANAPPMTDVFEEIISWSLGGAGQ